MEKRTKHKLKWGLLVAFCLGFSLEGSAVDFSPSKKSKRQRWIRENHEFYAATSSKRVKKRRTKQTRQSVEKITLKETKKPEKPFLLNIGGSHHIGAKEDKDPISVFYVSGTFKPHERHSITASLPATKLYSVIEGQQEFQVGDPSVAYSYLAVKDWNQFSVQPGVGFTLPLSQASRDIENITILTFKVGVSRPLTPKLRVSYTPLIRFFIHEFENTVDGNALTSRQLGHSLGLSYSLPARFTLASSVSGTLTYEFQNVNATQPPPATGSYAFNASLSHQFKETPLTATLGYSQADAFTKAGFVEYNLFDQDRTSYFLRLNLGF